MVWSNLGAPMSHPVPFRSIGEECGIVEPPLRHGNPTLHEATPDITQRLIRMVEELLERDDVRMGADTGWYWNRLEEIKKEVGRAAQEEAPGGTDTRLPSSSPQSGT